MTTTFAATEISSHSTCTSPQDSSTTLLCRDLFIMSLYSDYQPHNSRDHTFVFVFFNSFLNFWMCGSGLSASASTGNLLEIQNLGSYLKTTD